MAKQTFTTGDVLTAAAMTSLQQTAMGGGSTTAKTTSYTLVAADAGTVVQMNSASATTITVNTALFAAGDTVQIQNIGAGVCTVTAGTATVNTSATLALSQYDAGSLYFNTTSAALFFNTDAADSASSALTKINTTTFSAVASQAVNSVFTSTYKNYKLLITLSGASADGIFYLRMRAAGTDSSVNYFYGVPAINANGTAANQTGAGQAQFLLSDLDSASNASRYAFAIDVYNPQAAVDTSFGKVFNAVEQASAVYGGAGGGLHNVLTSYDGFSIIASAGNITGKVTTYGYSD